MHERLLHHVNRFVDLGAKDRELVRDAVRFRNVPKRKALLTPSKVCDATYFVLSGSLRLYVPADNGSDQILQFGLPDWWMSDYQSLESGMVSGYYIDAVEDAEVLVLDKQSRDQLFDRVPLFERYFRLLMQRGYAAGLRRMQYIFSGSREDLYLQFSRLYPDFVQTVPQYMLASFLGMTPEFLSKVRAKKRR